MLILSVRPENLRFESPRPPDFDSGLETSKFQHQKISSKEKTNKPHKNTSHNCKIQLFSPTQKLVVANFSHNTCFVGLLNFTPATHTASILEISFPRPPLPPAPLLLLLLYPSVLFNLIRFCFCPPRSL